MLKAFRRYLEVVWVVRYLGVISVAGCFSLRRWESHELGEYWCGIPACRHCQKSPLEWARSQFEGSTSWLSWLGGRYRMERKTGFLRTDIPWSQLSCLLIFGSSRCTCNFWRLAGPSCLPPRRNSCGRPSLVTECLCFLTCREGKLLKGSDILVSSVPNSEFNRL